MLSSNKKISELETKTGNLEQIVKVLKDEIFSLQEVVRDQGKVIAELSEKLEDKEAAMTAQAEEIRRWNEGLNNIMNYSLEVARGEKK